MSRKRSEKKFKFLRTLLTTLDREDAVIHQQNLKTAITINALPNKLVWSVSGNVSLFLQSNKIYLLITVLLLTRFQDVSS